MDINFKK